MNKDETLGEFVQILGRIKELVGDAEISDDGDINLDAAIETLRQAGKTQDADELGGLFKRANELKAQHQAKS